MDNWCNHNSGTSTSPTKPPSKLSDYLEYLRQDESHFFESDWDTEIFDSTTHEFETIKPPTANHPVSHRKYLGIKRKQPVLERFLLVEEGKIIVKLLEERLYNKTADFIISQYVNNPKTFHWSEFNWTKSWKDVGPVKILKTLCTLFDEGNTVIAYNIHKHDVVGVLIGRAYPNCGEKKKVLELINPDAHCSQKFRNTLQTFASQAYYKVHLLLVSPKYPADVCTIFSVGLINGFFKWVKYRLPRFEVNCVVAHPESARDMELYKLAGFGRVEHDQEFLNSGAPLDDESDVMKCFSQETCFLIRLCCCDEEEPNSHRYHGIIKF